MDMPDVDLIRRGNAYYMVSTTMFFMPGAPILKSYDLKNWEIVSYVFDRVADNDIYELKNGKHAYGKGQWATSLTYKDGMYYACFVCHDMKKTFIYYTDDIEKSFWDRYELHGVYHDMSFLFFKGRSFLVYGNGDIRIIELTDDLSIEKEGGEDRLLFSTPKENIGLRCEGCRAIVKDGYIYFLFIEWPSDGNKRRREVCYRSKELMGPYERRVIMDDDCGLTGRGIAQGTLIDDENGNWYCMLFQDHGAVGRIPFIMPASWENGWPVIGVGEAGTDPEQCSCRVPESFDVSTDEHPVAPIIISESFSHEENVIPLQFQWNHNPVDDAWSFTKRPGYLRLETSHIATGLLDARNTLTQRTINPQCTFSIECDVTGLKDGDYAGICAFMGTFGQIGITKENGEYYLVVQKKDAQTEKLPASDIPGFIPEAFFLKIFFDFEGGDKAYFYYSANGADFVRFSEPLQMIYTLDLFIGCRIGIFNYATAETGGHADFKNLEYK